MAKRKMTGPVPPRIDLRSRIYDPSEFAFGGKWVLVKSSNVHAMRYDYAARRLFVQFGRKPTKRGGLSPVSTYRYESVMPDVAKRMFMAASVGQFVHYVLKKEGYGYARIQ